MNNTINVNYMTRTYNRFLRNNEAQKGTERSFAESVEEKSIARTAVLGTSGTGAVSTQDMTMEE